MKKVFSILLIAVIIFSMTGVVAGESGNSATSNIDYDDIDSNNQATVPATVTLTLEELFTVTLPTSFVLELNDDKNAYADAEPLSVDVIRLDSDHSLEIYVSSVNADTSWNLLKGSIQNDNFVADNPINVLGYSMGVGTESSHVGETGNTALVPSSSNTLVEIAKNIRSDYSGYYIHVKADIPASGSLESAVYQDQLTFTVKLNTGSSV